MIYYKLTALKDMPDCEAGFSFTLSEEDLHYPHYIGYSKDADKKNYLRNHIDYLSFVKTEVDYSYANQDFVCPKCRDFTLFNYIGEKVRDYDAGIETWRSEVGLKCALCQTKFPITNVYVGKKVHW